MRILRAPDDQLRVIAPTTSFKIAKRMLHASLIVATKLPKGFSSSTPLDTLLALYVAEEDARYLRVADIRDAACSPDNVVIRWIDALAQIGLIDCQEDLLALSDKGHALVCELVESVYLDQRTLD